MANALAILLGKKGGGEPDGDEGDGGGGARVKAARLVRKAIEAEDDEALADALDSFLDARGEE
jgi:hypothetical protein